MNLENLDLQQRIAVTTDSKKVMVIAGAGSGKTRVLTSRVEYLIQEKKVSPYEIMCFTFTRAGANEMKTRLEKSIGNDVYKLHIGTMHSLALNYIRRFGEVLGIRPATVTVYNEWESQFLLKEVAKDLGIYNGKAWKIPKKEIDEIFNDYYAAGIEPWESHKAFILFNAFLQRCRENNALTYGGLILGFRMLIPELKKRLHVRHILIDEVQDIDMLQHDIISLLSDAFDASVFMVGDLSQSIFAWRGAVPEFMLDLQTRFDVHQLETNYRSVSGIVEAANRVIRNNKIRIPLEMRPTREGSGVQKLYDTDSEAVIKFIQTLIPYAGIQSKDITILARNHVLLKRISSLMDEQEIGHQYVGRKSDLAHSEGLRRFIAFFKLLLNKQDNFSFLLIKDILGLDRQQYGQIRKNAVETGVSHFEAWFCFDAGDFKNLFSAEYSNFDEIIDAVDSATSSPENQEITSFIRASKTSDLKSFLDWITTYDISDEAAETFEGIRLMTIHAAKGLEWPVVILAGCNEGLMPSKQAIGSGHIEEERRLFYVAMTRARDNLVLAIRPEKKEADSGKIYESPVSRFIHELA